MPNTNKNLPPLSAWLVDSLRVTAFPKPESLIAEQNWWFDVAGELPEKRINQPRTGVIVEEGPYQNGKLVLVMHPTRIDWRYDAADEMVQSPNQFPNVGEFISALHTFTSSVKKWLALENIPLLKRLALGTVLLQPVENMKEGQNLLSQYLPFDIDTETASDFLYQINRPRNAQTSISNLKINRLAKWSVASLIYAQIAPSPMVHLPAQYACHLELDINTVPEFESELEHDKLVSLLDEFVELSKEIVENGDIP